MKSIDFRTKKFHIINLLVNLDRLVFTLKYQTSPCCIDRAIVISNSYIALLYMTSQSALHLHVYMYYVYFTYNTQFFN